MCARWISCLLLGLAAALSARAADTNTALRGEASNIAGLAASASAEVVQDWVSLTLAVQRDGSDPAAVQAHLKKVLAQALQRARTEVVPRALEVSTGAFYVSPRYANDGRPTGWVGRAELVLAGSDVGKLSSLAGRLEGLQLTQTRWSLSPALRQRTEDEVQAQAVERFKARAQALAQQFGFSGYQLREVQIGPEDASPPVRPVFARAMSVTSAESMPVPLEAGSSVVGITVNGRVQFKP